MGDSEIVLRIEPVFNQRIDVVNIELALVQDQIDRFIADETAARLPRQQLLL
jgi:hypothetical protein